MRPWIALVLPGLLLAAGCGNPSSPGGAEKPRPVTVQLVPVPVPPLESLAPEVRQPIEERRQRLAAAEGPGGSPFALATAYGDLGMIYHAHQLGAAAEAAYANAAALAPAEMRWPYLLGQVRLEMGHPAEAVPAFEEALRLEPNDLPARIGLGKALEGAGRLDAAAQAYDAALAAAPNLTLAHFYRGQVALAQGDTAGAIARFEAARRLQPRAEALRRSLAGAYGRAGDRVRAQALAREEAGVPITFDDPVLAGVQSLAAGADAETERGAAAFAARRFDAAEAEFRQAVERRPDDADAHVNLGSALFRRGDAKAAEAELRRALELDGRNVLAAFNLGTLLAARGDREAAVGEYRRALASDPGYLPAHLNLGNALLALGRFADAREPFRTVVEANPRSAAARLGESIALQLLHRDAEARTRLEEGLRVLPGERSLSHGLARLLAASPDESVRDGRRALALAQELTAGRKELPHILALAMACAESGDFTQAVAWQEQALAAVRASPRGELVPVIEENLALYRQGKPCRHPWRGVELGGRW